MAYRADSWLLRRRAVNLLAELDNLEDRLELARALVGVHAPLAGMLAAFEFERRLRGILTAGSEANLCEHVKARAAGEDSTTTQGWQRGLALRDRMHDSDRSPVRAEVLELIDLAQRVEAP